MMTSIQISNKVKDQLFELLSTLQTDLGRKLTYEDVISYLISKQQSKLGERKEFSKNYFGILDADDAKRILQQGRQNERK